MAEKKFTLKSGNKPAFKMMAGESPITNSPYKQSDEVTEEKKGASAKDALKIGISALTGGLDAVYGSGKILFDGDGNAIKKDKTADQLKKEKEEADKKAAANTKTGAERVNDILGMNKDTIKG
tara:strand:+ start:1606 stop:1974 length:369 start_codon:yes stop_codon:yes gene_type:complete